MTPVIGGLIEAGMRIIDKVIPDPQAKAQAQLELMKLQQAGEFKQLEADLQLVLGQVEINKVEAASDDPFKSGWRPAAGWTCVSGLFYAVMLQPLIAWVSGIYGWKVPPEIDIVQLMALLVPMLGLGVYRTYEKVNKKT